MGQRKYDVLIIGGGAVGCAIAYTLARYDISICLIERNPDVAMGASGKNSGVVHAGFNNTPGSLMAKLCVEGNKEFESFCRMLDVPYRRTGKLVVAFDDDDLDTLKGLADNADKNGCVGVEVIDGERMSELEPNIGGVGALLSSNTAVFDPFLYTINLCEAAIQNGVDFFIDTEVKGINASQEGFVVDTKKGFFRSDVLINAAGLYSDKIADMAGHRGYRIYPARGQYLVLDEQVSELISRPVYPAPKKGVGGLGVHLTSTITGTVLVGPSAEYVDNKEEYATTSDVIEQLFSEAKQLLPKITRSTIIGAYTGIRSKIVSRGDSNFGDFIIESSEQTPGLVNLIGIESPGITSSIPIARMVCKLIAERVNLREMADYKAEYKSPSRFRDLSIEEQDILIASNSNYGEVICRCEKVTKAEVLQALHNSLGAHSVVSVKNRLNTTMGRCQGGYCLTRIVEMLIKELSIAPDEISYRYEGDGPFQGWVRQ
jgi:glycerol-3-phosphate dehydrogenase